MKTTECLVLIIVAIVVIGPSAKAEDVENPTATAEELYEDFDDDSMEPNEDEEDDAEKDDAIEDAGFRFRGISKKIRKSRGRRTTGLHVYNPPTSLRRRRWGW
eukprot:gene9738-10733_t